VNPPPQPATTEADERLRRAVMAIRQAFYSAADELGRLYGYDRPCKVCEERRRTGRVDDSRRTREAA
jgi:hypothetical protein